MNKKRLLALICATSLVVGTMTGCGAGTAEEGKTSEKAQVIVNTEGDGPAIIGNGETLVVGIQSNSLIEDYENNYFTQMLESALNINLEMVPLPSANKDFRTKVSMILAGGEDVPDVIIGSGLQRNAVREYGELGLLLPLNEFMEDPAMNPNWLAVPEDVRNQILYQCSTEDGVLYGFGKLNVSVWNNHPYRTYINKAWLEKLGLEMPKTTDELYTVLKAFANEDPNGNGKKDEMAVYGTASLEGRNTVYSLMNAFVFYNGGSQNVGLALSDNGKTVIAPFVTDEFREGLEYCRKLCEEGILPAAIFTDDKTQFEANLNAEVPVVGMVSTLSTSHWTNADSNPNFAELEMIVPVSGPDGVAYTPVKADSATMQYIITADCKYPELAYALGEYLYNPEVSLVSRFGIKDLDWTNNPEVVVPIAENRPEVTSGVMEAENAVLTRYKTEEDVWSQPNKTTWKNVNHSYSSAPIEIDAKSAESADAPTVKAREVFYNNYIGKYPKHILPVLVYEGHETETISNISGEISDYVDSSVAEFITGQRPLDDKTWDEYLKNLETLGLSTLLEASQKAYERASK